MNRDQNSQFELGILTDGSTSGPGLDRRPPAEPTQSRDHGEVSLMAYPLDTGGTGMVRSLSIVRSDRDLARTVREGLGFTLRRSYLVGPPPTAETNADAEVGSAELRNLRPDRIFVKHVKAGSLADESNLLPGDIILTINDNDVTQCTYDQVISKIQSSGTGLRMSVLTPERSWHLIKRVRDGDTAPDTGPKPSPPHFSAISSFSGAHGNPISHAFMTSNESQNNGPKDLTSLSRGTNQSSVMSSKSFIQSSQPSTILAQRPLSNLAPDLSFMPILNAYPFYKARLTTYQPFNGTGDQNNDSSAPAQSYDGTLGSTKNGNYADIQHHQPQPITTFHHPDKILERMNELLRSVTSIPRKVDAKLLNTVAGGTAVAVGVPGNDLAPSSRQFWLNRVVQNDAPDIRDRTNEPPGDEGYGFKRAPIAVEGYGDTGHRPHQDVVAVADNETDRQRLTYDSSNDRRRRAIDVAKRDFLSKASSRPADYNTTTYYYPTVIVCTTTTTAPRAQVQQQQQQQIQVLGQTLLRERYDTESSLATTAEPEKCRGSPSIRDKGKGDTYDLPTGGNFPSRPGPQYLADPYAQPLTPLMAGDRGHQPELQIPVSGARRASYIFATSDGTLAAQNILGVPYDPDLPYQNSVGSTFNHQALPPMSNNTLTNYRPLGNEHYSTYPAHFDPTAQRTGAVSKSKKPYSRYLRERSKRVDKETNDAYYVPHNFRTVDRMVHPNYVKDPFIARFPEGICDDWSGLDSNNVPLVGHNAYQTYHGQQMTYGSRGRGENVGTNQYPQLYEYNFAAPPSGGLGVNNEPWVHELQAPESVRTRYPYTKVKSKSQMTLSPQTGDGIKRFASTNLKQISPVLKRDADVPSTTFLTASHKNFVHENRSEPPTNKGSTEKWSSIEGKSTSLQHINVMGTGSFDNDPRHTKYSTSTAATAWKGSRVVKSLKEKFSSILPHKATAMDGPKGDHDKPNFHAGSASADHSLPCATKGKRHQPHHSIFSNLADHFSESLSFAPNESSSMGPSHYYSCGAVPNKIQGESATFDRLLEEAKPSESDAMVPSIVEKCVQIIETYGLYNVGIYRVPGNSAAVSALVREFDKDANGINIWPNQKKWRDVNVVASILKTYFRRLADPLLTNDFYSTLIEANRLAVPEERFITIKKFIRMLPDHHYCTLKYLMAHLSNIASKNSINRMDSRNLAIVFGPTIVRLSNNDVASMVKDMPDQCKIVESLITKFNWFFEEGLNSPYVTDNEDNVTRPNGKNDDHDPQIRKLTPMRSEIQTPASSPPHVNPSSCTFSTSHIKSMKGSEPTFSACQSVQTDVVEPFGKGKKGCISKSSTCHLPNDYRNGLTCPCFTSSTPHYSTSHKHENPGFATNHPNYNVGAEKGYTKVQNSSQKYVDDYDRVGHYIRFRNNLAPENASIPPPPICCAYTYTDVPYQVQKKLWPQKTLNKIGGSNTQFSDDNVLSSYENDSGFGTLSSARDKLFVPASVDIDKSKGCSCHNDLDRDTFAGKNLPSPLPITDGDPNSSYLDNRSRHLITIPASYYPTISEVKLRAVVDNDDEMVGGDKAFSHYQNRKSIKNGDGRKLCNANYFSSSKGTSNHRPGRSQWNNPQTNPQPTAAVINGNRRRGNSSIQQTWDSGNHSGSSSREGDVSEIDTTPNFNKARKGYSELFSTNGCNHTDKSCGKCFSVNNTSISSKLPLPKRKSHVQIPGRQAMAQDRTNESFGGQSNRRSSLGKLLWGSQKQKVSKHSGSMTACHRRNSLNSPRQPNASPNSTSSSPDPILHGNSDEGKKEKSRKRIMRRHTIIGGGAVASKTQGSRLKLCDGFGMDDPAAHKAPGTLNKKMLEPSKATTSPRNIQGTKEKVSQIGSNGQRVKETGGTLRQHPGNGGPPPPNFLIFTKAGESLENLIKSNNYMESAV